MPQQSKGKVSLYHQSRLLLQHRSNAMQSMSIASMDKQSLTGRLHVQVKPASLYVFRSVSTDLHLRAACLDGAASKAKEGKTLKGSGWQHLRVHCRHTISTWWLCGLATVQVPQQEHNRGLASKTLGYV